MGDGLGEIKAGMALKRERKENGNGLWVLGVFFLIFLRCFSGGGGGGRNGGGGGDEGGGGLRGRDFSSSRSLGTLT